MDKTKIVWKKHDKSLRNLYLIANTSTNCVFNQLKFFALGGRPKLQFAMQSILQPHDNNASFCRFLCKCFADKILLPRSETNQ